MRKLLIILAFLPLFAFNQTGLGTFNGGLWTFQGGLVTFTPLTWGDSIYNDYISINSHFSLLYQEEIQEYFTIVLDEGYIMPDGSDNYYQVYGSNGLGKKAADWLHYVRFLDSTSQTTLSIPKVGDVMKWQLEDSIYIQNNIPEHQITGTGKGLLTSTDGFTGVNSTTTYMGGASFTGEMPSYQFEFKRLFINGNSLFGTLPNFNNTAMTRINISTQFITEIEGIDNYISSSLEQFIAIDNMLSEESIDRLFSQLLDFYSVTTPTRAVTINVSNGTNSPPSAAGDADIVSLEAIFDLTIYDLNITTN